VVECPSQQRGLIPQVCEVTVTERHCRQCPLIRSL
jgi:hypothetical protein